MKEENAQSGTERESKARIHQETFRRKEEYKPRESDKQRKRANVIAIDHC